MIRRLLSTFTLLAVWSAATGCHSLPAVAAGHVQDHAYHSEYFHFVYPYPANTETMDVRSTSFPRNDPKGRAFWLFMARVGNLPSGVLVYAEDTSHYKSQVQTGLDYLVKIKRQWPQRRYYNVQMVVPYPDLTLYRMDYLDSATEYNSAVVGVLQGYAIVFKFNADSQEHLDTLVESIKSIRHG